MKVSIVKVGARVVRGPDWSWEDQDGREGNVGTVVEVKELTSDAKDSVLCGTTVIVCWDIGVLSNYRCGFGGKFDVRVYDNAQTGVSHPTVTCDGCSTSPVYGMRWKCATCYDYDLCTECYMSNKHSLEHRFLRYDTPESEGVPVPARSGGRRVKAKGFFKGAVVSRGKDWSWDDQDGGVGSTGVVKVIKGWRDESYRSVAEVEWGTSGNWNVYRVGHKGKVDLKCDTPGDGGEYYPNHLPMSEHADAMATVSVDTHVATVASTTISNDKGLTTAYEKEKSRKLLFHFFQVGDVVRVIDDIAKLHQIQEELGLWIDSLALCLGQLGRVVYVQGSTGVCAVKVNGYFKRFSPQALIPAPGESPPELPTVADDSVGLVHVIACVGDAQALRDVLLSDRSAVDRIVDGIRPLQVAAHDNHTECIRVLLEYKCTVNVQDLKGMTPIHWSCARRNAEAIKMLLAAGADPAVPNMLSFNCLHTCAQIGFVKGCKLIIKKYPNLLNLCKDDGFSPLHLASLNNHCDVAKFLLDQEKCDIDAVTGSTHTALHLAVRANHPSMVEILVGYKIDLNAVDGNGRTALHYAVNDCPPMDVSHSSELSKISSELSDLPSPVRGSAAVACLLVREGADPYKTAHDGLVHTSPLMMSSDLLMLHLTRFVEKRSTFHGSLRKSPKPTPADLVEEEDTPKPHKAAEELTKPADEGRPVGEQERSTPLVTPKAAPISQTTPTVKKIEEKVCLEEIPTFSAVHTTSALACSVAPTTTTTTTTVGHSDEATLPHSPATVMTDKGNPTPQLAGQLYHSGDVQDDGRCANKTKESRSVNFEEFTLASGEIPLDDSDGSTTCYNVLASLKGDARALRAALSRDPTTVDATIGPGSKTALHAAAFNGNIECVRVLLEFNASLDLRDTAREGATALHLACDRMYEDVVEMLMKAGADPCIRTYTSWNALHICAHKGCLRSAQLILSKYPHLLKASQEDGFNPLHMASRSDEYLFAKFLIEHENCDIDAITDRVQTALHVAVDSDNARIAELLIGHGIDLDVVDVQGATALHMAVYKDTVVGITDDSPELSKICSTLSGLPGSMIGSAAVACLLVREGADPYCKGGIGKSSLEICSEELVPHLLRYTEERSTFHGSLRKSPKPTPADLVEEEDTPKPQRTEEEPSVAADDQGPVRDQNTDKPTVAHMDTHAGVLNDPPTDTPTVPPTDTPLSQTTLSPQQPPDNDDEACLLCDRPVDVRIEPCGHTVLCRSHANTAKRCPQCRGPIHSIADLEPLCGMCQESVCSVTLKPCDHMMCSDCALRMKFCFECKTKITSKEGLISTPAVKSESDPTSITTTDSSVSISDESILCEICVSNKKNIAFTCGHQLCYDCSLKVDKCPICREMIKLRIKLH